MGNRDQNMIWTDQAIETLRQLWLEVKPDTTPPKMRHATIDIARIMGITKNAVVGKAHRLYLPPRPSPIRYNGEPKQRKPKPERASAVTLPALLSQVAIDPLLLPPVIEAKPVITAKPIVSRVLVRHADGSGCAFPIGHPRERGFLYCDGDLSEDSRVYCPEHYDLCIERKVRRKIEPPAYTGRVPDVSRSSYAVAQD